ncbi:MAG: hypothetical protein CVU09_18080 [Bacteroidetes bacterium HGW-Bacteroidetes-4]|jgi:putative endonuclease|nr:MAG: hypothetical protein CVU09_18080 [Bacteroidetes bacterium HGW-Bacteroidetes-4]
MKVYYVYILECSDGSYYTGITSNLSNRYIQHQTGFYKSCYTYNKRPLEMVFFADFTEVEMAIAFEKQVKKWSRAKKKALIEGKMEELIVLAKKKFKT